MANFLIGKGLMLAAVAVVITVAMASCQTVNNNVAPVGYQRISAAEAMVMMDRYDELIILDVRTEEEFSEGHIPGAILIPDYELAERAETELPNKDQLILVYCRSGRRSKTAAEMLVGMGYTNVKDFGGIIDWEYDIEK